VNNAQRIYAATITGVWMSSNGGTTWTQSLGNLNPGCQDLALRTDTPTDYLFAACSDGSSTTDYAIWRNQDVAGSGVWTMVQTAPHMVRTSLALAPSQQSTIYAMAATVAFQADRTCPIFPDLSRMLEKTAGLADVVRFALAPLASKIEIAFIYGSVASREERSSSDVDLMIVGKANLADLAVVIRPLEEELGRSVNVSVYTTQEFRKRRNERNHFLSSVLKTELLFIVGRPDDLARFADRTARKGS